MDLFAADPDEIETADDGTVIEIPRTLEQEIATFVYRWIRPEVREAVTVELVELIAFAKEQA